VVVDPGVGLRKPEPAIYRRAADELAVPLGRIVFVDDIAANLQPAHELGIAVIHQVDPARTVRELERLLGHPEQLLLGHGSPSWLETRSVNHPCQFQNPSAGIKPSSINRAGTGHAIAVERANCQKAFEE
jgi:hypothetical protein